MNQSKERDLLNEYKNKTHIYVVYEGYTSDLEKNIDWEWKILFHANRNLKKSWSINTIIRKKKRTLKTVIRDKERHIRMTKESIQYDNCKYMCAQHSSTSMYMGNVNREKKLTVTQ